MRAFILFTILLTYNFLHAQPPASSKSQRLYNRGQEMLKSKKIAAAEQAFLKAIKETPNFTEGYIALGELYCDNRQYAKAAGIFQMAASSCPQCTHAFALSFAQSLCRAQQYERAETILSQWVKPVPMHDRLQKQYNQVRQNIQFGKYAVNAKRTDEPENMSFRVNTQYDEYFPSISPDDSTIVFTRKTNGIDEDFYIAYRDSCGGWFGSRDMGSPPNSSEQEGAQMLSADGHYLFFMRCGNRSENGWEAGGCDLYFSYTEKGGWSQPVPFGATINTPGYEGMPSLSSDNRELFFVSNREGGFGGKDIWVARFQDGLWQLPENLGHEINTPYDETAPFIASDNQTLYFTSDGHPGMGGNDIYFSRRSMGRWKRPENLGYPLNTAAEEVSACISPSGKKIYFSSDREGGIGGMDLYEVALPQVLQPLPYTYVYGITYDSLDKSNRLTYAQMEWTDAETGEELYRFQSNKGDASYMAAVALDRKYALHIYRTGYADYDDTVTFTTSNTLYPDTLNFALLSFNYSPPLLDTMLLHVNFVKNVITVSDTDKAMIQDLVTPYLNQPFVEFFVNGYTDDSGTPYLNEELSFTRARAIADWLRILGVPDSKIHTQGWADAQPIAPNDTDENRFINRRVEITIRRPQ